MKLTKYLLLVLINLYILASFVSCNRDKSSISFVQEPVLTEVPIGGFQAKVIYIDFADTSSNDLIISFLSKYDSINILPTYLGVDLFMYADSGDYSYWLDLFRNNSFYFNLSSYYSSDSLILIFRFLDEDYYLKGKDMLIKNKHLHFKNVNIQNKHVLITIPDKSVIVTFPDNSENRWINFFRQFDFIEHVELFTECPPKFKKVFSVNP